MLLSLKKSNRVFILKQVVTGRMTTARAAGLLGLSDRQVRRMKARIQAGGLPALAHASRGRPPKNATSPEVRAQVLALVAEAYRGANVTHLAELRAERLDLDLSAKTVGRILKAAGIPSPRTHRSPRKYRRRARKEQEGLLAQVDASKHRWLGPDGPWWSLHGAIDDASGKVLGLHFRPTEDTAGYFHVLRQLITRHGVPGALYSDRHTLFVSPLAGKLSVEEQLQGRKASLTEYGRALEQLGITLLTARSPQAKGRIERLWGTLQDRLVLEMHLAGIRGIDDADKFLEGYIQRHNSRFAVEAADTSQAYGPAPASALLDDILAIRVLRVASADSTIALDGQRWVLVKDGRTAAIRAKAKVTILTDLSGNRKARVDGKAYVLQQACPADKKVDGNTSTETHKPAANIHPPKPAANHPWRRMAEAAAKLAQDRQTTSTRPEADIFAVHR
jgi:transposase